MAARVSYTTTQTTVPLQIEISLSQNIVKLLEDLKKQRVASRDQIGEFEILKDFPLDRLRDDSIRKEVAYILCHLLYTVIEPARKNGSLSAEMTESWLERIEALLSKTLPSSFASIEEFEDFYEHVETERAQLSAIQENHQAFLEDKQRTEDTVHSLFQQLHQQGQKLSESLKQANQTLATRVTILQAEANALSDKGMQVAQKLKTLGAQILNLGKQ